MNLNSSLLLPSLSSMAKLQGEMFIFIQVWLTVCISLCYCYIIAKFLPTRAAPRLFAVLPVVSLFLLLPLQLSSVHLAGVTSFFIAWLANFKLLLFAFGRGPLCSDPSLSLTRFVILASLPIQIKPNPPNPLNKTLFLTYLIKGLLVGLLLHIYEFNSSIHPKLILILYFIHIYLFLDLVLALAASLTRFLLGAEMEPQFDEPYLASSLQDFWGRRWNIMVNCILHSMVYVPLRDIAAAVVGRRWAAMPAVVGTFSVSALMHELIYYYLGREKPTWEITGFFLLHGVCVAAEIGVKKSVNGGFRPPKLMSIVMTLGFVVVTGFWLFFPQLLRCRVDVRAFEEYAAVGAFVKDIFI